MKKVLLFLVAIFVIGCQESGIVKPNNLIEKDKMVNVLYDISLLEAVKNQNISGGITPEQINKFIYKKYKIDSLQFVNSNKYYASEVEEYKKMFQKVKDRLEAESKKLEAQTIESNKTNDAKNSETPTVY